MTSDIIPFRAPDGTTARDLADVRRILTPGDGWTVGVETNGPAPWITVDGPDGSSREIGRANGKFHVTDERCEPVGPPALATAESAARIVLASCRVTLRR